MVSNEFDIEKAKAGEPVEMNVNSVIGDTAPTWKPVHFVGMSRSGFPVVQDSGISNYYELPFDGIRMAPKTVKVRYRSAILVCDRQPFVTTCTENHGPSPAEYENWPSFAEWIHADWQEVEIAQ